jgi:threonylcarbamoyladenosine tRNA methylthiotransferase MtaB
MIAPAPTIETLSFGCRLNIVESEAMRDLAGAAGLRDALIVNTCAVTSEAARQSRQAVRRAVRERPDTKIVVTGCAAEIDGASFDEPSGRVLRIANAAKTDPATWMRLAPPDTTPAFAVDPQAQKHTRGFVAIQNGCDHRCTFCIIPFGRGASRSTPAADVVTEVRARVETGHADVILTGVDLTAWGADLPGRPTLGGLVRAILRGVPDLRRLRLSSVDCIEMDGDLLDAFANEERLMPHLHLSLQSGDDMILKRMKRRHGRDDAIALCRKLLSLRPDIVFGADLIAGFPTETQDMFAQSLALVEECGLTHLHVFPYSPRPGTPAARMPAVAAALVQERAAQLREAGAQSLRLHLDAQVGKRLEILAERGATGRARDFTPVALPAGTCPGTIADFAIAGHDGRRLIAA